LVGSTPSGLNTYLERLNAVINTSITSGFICKTCAEYINQLEILHLKMIQIENSLFNLFHNIQPEPVSIQEEICHSDDGAAELHHDEPVKIQPKRPQRLRRQPPKYRDGAPMARRHVGGEKKSLVCMTSSSEPERNICTHCKKPYKTRRLLAKHLLKAHCEDLALVCGLCGAPFTSLPLLKKHEQMEHAKMTTCSICGKSVTKASMYSHEKLHHQKEQHICDVCSRIFSTAGNLGSHMRTHTVEKPFECAMCSKSFKWSSSLNTHIQAAHNSLDASFKCNVCERGFKNKTNLRKHEFTHSNLKPFQCGVCSKGFIRRDLYSRHIQHCS